ncbi:MAG: helix-turn-helix domain-containing protein, partial [Megasphaera sp.]|nr:helix-turn-helix domain-containing protein [Megasphaera sp.]
MGKDEHQSSLLKSLEKSLDVLDLFVECNTGMTLKEIAEHTGLNTSTAFRIVNTLERRQYLTRSDASKKYRLGPKALALGYSSHWTENVVTLAKPYLRRLQQLFNETVSIYIAEGEFRICLDYVESTHSL